VLLVRNRSPLAEGIIALLIGRRMHGEVAAGLIIGRAVSGGPGASGSGIAAKAAVMRSRSSAWRRRASRRAV
jgi:hypothetical protein